MRSFVWLAAAATLASAVIAAQAPTTPQEPTATFEPFLVSQADGSLTPLEHAPITLQRQGRTSFAYADGEQSSVSVTLGQPITFTVRLVGAPKTQQERRSKAYFKLEPLAVRGARRYGTRKFVPLDVVQSYGEIEYGLAPRRPEWGGQSFLFKPRTPLPAGEYALSQLGLLSCYDCEAGDTYAFRVVER